MAKKTVNILYIEDNKADVHLVKLFLKNSSFFKYELASAPTLSEGIYHANNEEVDLVFLDLNLPDSTGFKTLDVFFQKVTNIPLIVMTGINDETIGMQAVKAGAQDFLVKGEFNASLIQRSIRYALQRFEEQKKIKETAHQLKIAEKKFLDAQEMAHFGTWEVDIVNNEMRWSDEVYRIFGMLPQGIKPRLSDYFKYVHPHDREFVETTFNQCIRDTELQSIEYRTIINNNIKFLKNQIKVIFEEPTQRYLLTGAIQDITDQKRSQELLAERFDKERNSKIRTQILNGIGFQVKTPLSSVFNLSYLINNDLKEVNPEYASALLSSVEDLSSAVQHMMNFSVLVSDQEEKKEEAFNIETVITSIFKLFNFKADSKKIELKYKTKNDTYTDLIGDQLKINQVIYNLIDLFLGYTKEDEQITLKLGTSNKIIDNLTLNLTFQVGKNKFPLDRFREVLDMETELTDDTLQESDQEMISTLIIRRFLDELDARFQIEEKVSSIFWFVIDIPLKINRKIETILKAPKTNRDLKVLLVEDHVINQITTKKILTSWKDNLTVELAENGKVGVEKFRDEHYDLILMDLQMPEMDGFDATLIIRELNNRVPIIALSANDNPMIKKRCKDVGMNEYIVKPFSPDELKQKINTIVK